MATKDRADSDNGETPRHTSRQSQAGRQSGQSQIRRQSGQYQTEHQSKQGNNTLIADSYSLTDKIKHGETFDTKMNQSPTVRTGSEQQDYRSPEGTAGRKVSRYKPHAQPSGSNFVRERERQPAQKETVISADLLQTTDRDNWQDGKTLKECNLFMLTYEIACDVTFLVGDDKELLRCHKYVLMSRNSKFSKVLQRFQDETHTLLTIPDIQPDLFKELIRYIYTDEIQLNFRLATELLYPAHKFGVASLLRSCFEFLLSEVSSDNVCNILEIAHTYSERYIYERCLRFIYVNAVDVLKVANFRELCRECVREIVSSDDLLAEESQVYDALINWANRACTRNSRRLQLTDEIRREVLDDLLFCVRFPFMDVNVFTQRISKQNVLLADEKISLFQFFHGEVNTLPQRFNRKGRRKYTINKEIVRRADVTNYHMEKLLASQKHQRNNRQSILPIEDPDKNHKRERQLSYENMYTDMYTDPEQPILRVTRYKGRSGPWNLYSPDAISFKCSSTIILRGVQVFGPYKGTDYYSVTLTLFDEFRNEIRKEEINIFTDKAKVYDVLLLEPTRVPKERIFTVQVVMKGKPTIHGTRGVPVVVSEDVQFEFINSNRSTNGTDVTIGQIPALLFSKR